MLKRITLLKDRVEDWAVYPFSVPTIASLTELEIESRIVFFAGENGTGKSTLLEAIAAHYGFGPEGGNRNFSSNSTLATNPPHRSRGLCVSLLTREQVQVSSFALKVCSI